MKSHLRKSLLIGGIAIFAVGAVQSSNADLMKSAVVFMQKGPYNTGNGVLKVDARVLPVGAGMTAALGKDDVGQRHNAPTLAAVEIPAVSQVVPPERAARCAASAPEDCMQNGASVVAAFGVPTFRNDTATIEVLLQRSEHVSPADSAERVKRPGGIMGVRLRRAGKTFGHLTAVKEGAAWVVKTFKVVAQT
jgi:hypothetical protein